LAEKKEKNGLSRKSWKIEGEQKSHHHRGSSLAQRAAASE